MPTENALITYYPVGFAFLAMAAIAALGWWRGDRSWGQTLTGVAAVQALGLIGVVQAMNAADYLQPSQFLFAFIAIGITTKLVVFSPLPLSKVTAPETSPTLSRRGIIIGVGAAWLIQSTLSVLFLFPDEILEALVLWVLPTSPVYAFAGLLLIGVVVVQVTMAGEIHTHDPGEESVVEPSDSAQPTEPSEPASTGELSEPEKPSQPSKPPGRDGSAGPDLALDGGDAS